MLHTYKHTQNISLTYGEHIPSLQWTYHVKCASFCQGDILPVWSTICLSQAQHRSILVCEWLEGIVKCHVVMMYAVPWYCRNTTQLINNMMLSSWRSTWSHVVLTVRGLMMMYVVSLSLWIKLRPRRDPQVQPHTQEAPKSSLWGVFSVIWCRIVHALHDMRFDFGGTSLSLRID